MTDPYELLARATGFQWDAGNSDKNLQKHGVTNSEVEQIFLRDPMIAADKKHSSRERRFFALGVTDAARPLFVVFTFRKTEIRVISARDMSKKERMVFFGQ